MLKKRIIFTLLYKNKKFVMSRNFITNSIGDSDWIIKNYNFIEMSKFIDELIIINIDDDKKNIDHFVKSVKFITKNIFIPIVLAGQVDSIDIASLYFKNYADKIMINSSLYKKPKLIEQISKKFGRQSIIASIDYTESENNFFPKINRGKELIKIKLRDYLKYVLSLEVGEVVLNSIDRDGTGQGCDPKINKFVKFVAKIPVIISGGVGNYNHMIDILKKKDIDAIATANLLNFVGDGLKTSREKVIQSGINLARW